MRTVTIPVFTLETYAELQRRGELRATLLRFEYVAWRRSVGLEPPKQRINQWQQGWKSTSEPLDEIAPGCYPPLLRQVAALVSSAPPAAAGAKLEP